MECGKRFEEATKKYGQISWSSGWRVDADIGNADGVHVGHKTPQNMSSHNRNSEMAREE